MIGDATLIDDRSLLEHYARTRDAKAFNELARRYSGLVYGTCLRVMRNPDDAQDVSQECFLELARRAGTIRSSLAGWLHKVAKTRSINAIRRDSALRSREQQWTLESESHDAGSEWAEIAPLVDGAVEKLPEHLRIPVVLHYFQGLEQTQIAYHLRVNQSTVSRRLDKAVDALRKELQRAGVVVSVAALGVLLAGKTSTAAPAALTAALGRMAITGPSGAGAASALVVPQLAAKQVLGTLAGKLAVAGLVGVVALSVTYKTTRSEPADTAYAAAPAADTVAKAAPVKAQAARPAPAPVMMASAVKAPQVAVTPMESYRGDPFAPANSRITVGGVRAKMNAPIADLPVPRISIRPVYGSGFGVSQVPPPVQPSRRMSGLVLNNGVAAIVESNGHSEVVVPGQMLSDKLAVVKKIESNRVILKTIGDNPMEVVAGLTPSPSASQINPPTAPGTPQPAARPAMGVPMARPRGGMGIGIPMRRPVSPAAASIRRPAVIMRQAP